MKFYICKNISAHQDVKTKILKGNEHLYGESRFAVCMPNSEIDLLVSDYRTLLYTGKDDEVIFFGERIKDSCRLRLEIDN